MSTWTDEPRIHRDVLGGILGLLAAVVMLPMQLIATGTYIQLLPVVVGGASLCYLAIVRADDTRALPQVSKTTAHLLPVGTLLLFSAMVLVAGFQGRTIPFYYLAAWAGVLLFVQVLFVPDADFHHGLILGQIVLFGLIVRGAALYTTPGYVGIDVWSHVPHWSAAILDTHSLAPIADAKYYASPLFHLLVVTGSLLLDVTLRQSVFLTLGLSMPVAALFVYGATVQITEPRWAVLAAAIFTASGNVIEWGIHLIPTSLGLLFFVAVVYALIRVLIVSSGWKDYLLVVLFSTAVIFTHQISSMILLVLVAAGLLANVLVSIGVLAIDKSADGLGSSRRSMNLVGLLVFDLGLVTFNWSMTPYRGRTFLGTMGNWFIDTLTTSAAFGNLARESTGAPLPQTTFLEIAVSYVDALGFLGLLFIAIVGGLAGVSYRNGDHATATCVIAMGIMLLFVFGFPLFGIRMFVPSRWYAFLVVPMAVLAGVGARTLSDRGPVQLTVVLLLLFAVVFPVVSVISSDASQDAPVFDEVQTRYSYTETELAAVETLETILVPDEGGHLHTDHPYNTVFKRLGIHTTRVTHIVAGETPNRMVLYREYQRSGAAYFATMSGRAHQPSVSRAAICSNRDIVYDNGDVALCVDPPASGN